jgi:hypothetical protein
VVDWGCGYNNGSISSQVKKLRCRKLTSVDLAQEYVFSVYTNAIEYEADEHEFVISDVRDYARKIVEEDIVVDLSLCLDIVEHFELEDAMTFVKNVIDKSKITMIWIPLGYAPVTRDVFGGSQHELHTHRSTWDKEMLEGLGFSCEVFPNFHTGMFGHRVDACWALMVKNVEVAETKEATFEGITGF